MRAYIKTIVFTILVFFFAGIPYSFAEKLETINFDDPKNSKWEITLDGFFDKTGISNPNDRLFTYFENLKTAPLGLYHGFEYIYLGRTGEKTFEIQHIIIDFVKEIEKKEKISMYFVKGDLYPLKRYRMHSSCSNEDNIFLKMVNLKGNQLEYQIILPDCLKKGSANKK